MDSITVVKDQIDHFSHEHSLSLVHLQQPNHKHDNSDDEDENEEKDDFVEEVRHGGKCKICREQIWSFYLCYYYCKSCDYSLHTFCAELPKTLQTYPSHPNHALKFSYNDDYDTKCFFHTLQNYPSHSSHTLNFVYPNDYYRECFVCRLEFCNIGFYYFNQCNYIIDAICATLSEQKIKHPSHPHQLERVFKYISSMCVACGNKHEGVFFHCTTCPMFHINMDCALLPAKLLIQTSTNGTFTHAHPLTLTYSFPFDEIRHNYFPCCRVCNKDFRCNLWNYKCDKCRFYVHIDCATSMREQFMSIFQPASVGKTYKNYREDEHPNLLHCPFQDEGDLVKHHMSNQKGKEQDGEMLNHSCHQHQLILFDKQTSVGTKLISLHDPMKRVQLLCDGCVKLIMAAPFYMCCKYADEQCCFVLHEWCANLPSQIQDYFDHPKHPLVLLPKIPTKFFGVFDCEVCYLPSNGFAYGCRECEYYVDINCAFIPNEITHEAHPGHLLLKVKPSSAGLLCKACHWEVMEWGFHCPTCEFYIDVRCALLLPGVIKHKLDKHPLSLRYEPAENHIEEYSCEVCEEEFNPWKWFYHCTTCAQSMHPGCAPLILQSQYEQDTSRSYYGVGIYDYLNMKFGGKIEIKDHPHPLSFVQGIESDGKCSNCREEDEYYKRLKYKMIFKCLECEFAIHYNCASFLFAN